MRTRFSLRLSPFTSFPFSQARKHNWPEYSLWDHGPTSVVGQVICWDHGPTCIAGQVICLGPWSHFRRWSGYLLGPRSHFRRWSGYLLGPRSHLRRRSGYLPGTMVPPPSSVRLSAWDHGPTCIVGTLLVWDNGSINACHEQVLACRHQPVERSNHAAERLLQAMVKALLGSERSMLSEICKI